VWFCKLAQKASQALGKVVSYVSPPADYVKSGLFLENAPSDNFGEGGWGGGGRQ
jgi:hypothetical protein